MIRKGGITRIGLRRRWAHHVALPADKVLGLKNSEIVQELRLPYRSRR